MLGLCIDSLTFLLSKFWNMVILFTNINEEMMYKCIPLNNTPTIVSLFLYILMDLTALFSPFGISYSIAQLLLAPVKALPEQILVCFHSGSQKPFIGLCLDNLLLHSRRHSFS